MLKRLFLVALTTLAILPATGCGKTPGMVTLAAPRTQAAVATVFAAGQARKLGFDMGRYQSKQAPKAHLTQLPPTQGLTPTKVDLRAQCSPVADQYDLGACTAFAVAKGMREYLQAARKERAVSLSALFVYYETRALRNTVDLDSGATVTDAMKAIATSGAAPEAMVPYDLAKFTLKPAPAAYKAAVEQKLTTGVQLAGLEDIKKALAKKQPVVLGMRIYKNFQSIGANGKLELPQNGDIMVGGHAVAVVGYDSQRRVLIVKNSWGSGWGDQGYFYMPYAYVTPENVMDIWTAS